MIKGLEGFTHGQIRDALNILEVMEKQSLTKHDLEEQINEMAFSPHRKQSRRGFLRRTTLAERKRLQAQRGIQRQPCKRCDEKRRGKK